VRTLRLAVSVSAIALVLGATVLVAPGAGAGEKNGNDAKRVRVFDDCDPATFDAAFGPGTCVKQGDTVLDSFFAQLAAANFKLVPNQSVKGWKFKPGRFHVESGDAIKVVNKGGEFHTFTMVANFGGGCIQGLNDFFKLTPVPECQPVDPITGQPVVFATSGVVSGGTLRIDTTGLAPGVYKFECLIHPWMHSVVRVRADDHHDD
jgi:plastocyanin